MSNENEIFAVQYAALAREIAQDIFPHETLLQVHQMTEGELEAILRNPKFQQMVNEMSAEWNAAANTKERVRIKAATGLEAMLEEFVLAIANPEIPFSQKVEAGKFLAKMGQLDPGLTMGGGGLGAGIQINISMSPEMKPLTIDVPPTIELVPVEDATVIPEDIDAEEDEPVT